MSASLSSNASAPRNAPTPLMQQPPMIFLLGLVGVTLLTACVAVIILTIKLGSDTASPQVSRANPSATPPNQPTVITQVPPQPKPRPESVATVIPKQEAKAGAEGTVIPKQEPRPPTATDANAGNATNPWSLTSPNAMGVPVRGHTAIIVDAVEQSEPFLAPVLDALVNGLAHDQPNTTASVFYINDNQIKSFGGNPAAVGSETSNNLAAFQESIEPAGRTGFWKGFDAGANSDASQIVIITGRKSWDSSIRYLKQKLKPDGDDKAPLVTFVHIDADVPSLGDALHESSNDYVTIPLDQLNAWQSAAR